MKICVNCGKEVLDTAKFCIYCNARQPDITQNEEEKKIRAPKSEEPAQSTQPQTARPAESRLKKENDEDVQPEKSRKSISPGGFLQLLKEHRPVAVIAAAIVLVLAVILGITGTHKAEIDLGNYTNVQFSGYNGAGTARVEFDQNALLADVATAMAKKRKVSRSFAKNAAPDTIRTLMNDNWEDGAKIELAAESCDCTLDNSQNLSNGDIVTVSYRYDNEKAADFGFRFRGENKSFTVSELSEIDRFDAFEGIDVSISGPDGFGEAVISKTGTEELYSRLQYTADKEHGLHNGDSVTVTLTTTDGGQDFSEFGRTYGKVPAETTKRYDVSGLTEVPTFDAFAGLSVTVEGTEPFGYIYLANTDTSNDIWYEADRYDGLSNGDTVTVRAVPGYTGAFNAQYAEIYGQIPETDEKIVEIQGLPGYISSLSDIPTDYMTELKAEAQDRLYTYVTTEWNAEYDRMNSGTYKGAYLLTAKDNSIGWNRNQLFLIYEVNATAKDGGESRDITFYYYMRAQDIQKLNDGSCTADLTLADTPEIGFDTGFSGHYYKGYASLDELVGNMITSQESMYTIESEIPGQQQEAPEEQQEAPEEQQEATEEQQEAPAEQQEETA